MNNLTDRYQLLDELGRGGMATVHRARDLRHNRDVAIKVMHPNIAASIGAGRFLREIEIAAGLQHPQIVPVFDSGDADGQLFYVMPLIEGETLRARLDRDKQLPVDEAVRLGREVAEALDYAHGQGVLHRDLKPANILLSRGHALLADFGIARAGQTEATDDATQVVTQAGMMLGTPAYMSPEQAAGERDLGPASDIYSLGCLIFEMIAGESPFAGGTAAQVLSKRFTTEAPRVGTRCESAPPHCDTAIARALQREPAARFASAQELADALAGSFAAKGAVVEEHVGDRSIAVVPFDNLSPDPNDSYLADGLVEELITDLSKVPALCVIARNSSAAARARTGDLKEIARMLDVRYLLEGSVRRAGNQLRITAQLIDGATDAHLWAEKYGGTMDDVFDMQERISAAIVGELRVRLTDDQPEVAATPPTDIETYQLYLRAKHHAGQSAMRIPEAMQCLEQAIDRDPNFVPAYCMMGTLLFQGAFFGQVPTRMAWDQIQQLADRALAIDPRSGAAHELLASVAAYRDWDWTEAKRLYRRAAELDPGSVDHCAHAFMLAFRGELDEALAAARKGHAVDPLSYFAQLALCGVLVYQRDWDTAFRTLDRLIDFDPNFPEGYHFKAYALIGRGEWEAALGQAEKAVALSNRSSWPMAKLGCALIALGRADEAQELVAELERRSETEIISFAAIATVHLHLGDHDAFYRALDRAHDDRDPIATALKQEFLWDAARGESAFRARLQRLGLAE